VHGRHIVAERAGHWIQFDDPELVIATIRDVWSRGFIGLRSA
jgi:pimeloyl-ACP methyl ester carboxylesterase